MKDINCSVELDTCRCPSPIVGAEDKSIKWCVENGECGCVHKDLLGMKKSFTNPPDRAKLKEQNHE